MIRIYTSVIRLKKHTYISLPCHKFDCVSTCRLKYKILRKISSLCMIWFEASVLNLFDFSINCTRRTLSKNWNFRGKVTRFPYFPLMNAPLNTLILRLALIWEGIKKWLAVDNFLKIRKFKGSLSFTKGRQIEHLLHYYCTTALLKISRQGKVTKFWLEDGNFLR